MKDFVLFHSVCYCKNWLDSIEQKGKGQRFYKFVVQSKRKDGERQIIKSKARERRDQCAVTDVSLQTQEREKRNQVTSG